MKNFQQTLPFNPPQMFYTTQRRRRRGQKIRHCFCMFCVCVKETLLKKFSSLKFFAPSSSSSSCPVFWCSQMLLSQPGGFLDRAFFGAGIYSGSLFLKLLFHNKYKFWNLGRNLLDFFLVGKYNRRRMWFFVKGTRSRSRVTSRFVTLAVDDLYRVCVCVCIKRMRITKWLTFLFF